MSDQRPEGSPTPDPSPAPDPDFPPTAETPAMRRPTRRLAKVSWFGLLWLAGLGAFALLAFVIRSVLT